MMNLSEQNSKEFTYKKNNKTSICSSLETVFKPWETLYYDECNITVYERSEETSIISKNSCFFLIKDHLVNLNSSQVEKMIIDFNELLIINPTHLVYWLEYLNTIFFCNILKGVNARWSSFDQYYIIFILLILIISLYEFIKGIKVILIWKKHVLVL